MQVAIGMLDHARRARRDRNRASAISEGGMMSGDTDAVAARPAMSPLALPVADAARVLSAAAGRSVTVEQIQSDIDAGAPTNVDGTINLVHYAAWLVKELTRSAD